MARKKWALLLLLTVLFLMMGCGEQGLPQKLLPEDQDGALGEPVITLYRHQTDDVVAMPLEEYLLGVVAAEMDPTWPRQALAAQALMARTFTLEKIASGGVAARGTDASTDIQEFQAYDAAKINDNVRQAVAETRGQVITYQGQLIKAWFFADGGGLTAASSAEGLAYDKTETPYIHSVSDPGSALGDNPNQNWQAVFTLAEVADAVEAVTGQRPQQITTAAIAEQGPSGRATWLTIGETSVSATGFRLAIGSEKMKSTLLKEITVTDHQLRLTGSGYGHGVGMSQWGAKALAEEGQSAAAIIHYFLKDVEIVSQYA